MITEYAVQKIHMVTKTHSSSSSIHWPSLFQFGLSGFAILFVWGIALSLFTVGALQFVQGVPFRRIDPSGFLMAGGFAFVGTLLIPSAWFALMRLMNRPVNPVRWATWKNVRAIIWLLPPVVLAGYGVAVTPSITWLLLPLFNVLALSIPVVWYLSIGGRGLHSSSPQSAWGIFGTGLALGPGLILFIELIVGLVAVVILGVWLSQEPGFLDEVQRLARVYQFSSNPDPSLFLPFAERYLMRPSVLGGGLVYIAGFVPLLEEFFKPIGLLFLNKQTLTPAQGFLAGMLSGAAFGLFENLLQAVSGPEWLLLAVGRTGTSLIHIFNSGLVGWGFALAWQDRRPMALIRRYLIAVVIHAIWNGMTVMVGVASLPEQDLVGEPWMLAGTVVLLLLTGICFFALIAVNRRLQRETQVVQGTSTSEQRERSLPELGEALLDEGFPPEAVISSQTGEYSPYDSE